MSGEQSVEIARAMLDRFERQPNQKMTVAQMVEFCHERGLDPAVVRVHGGFTFAWKSPETNEEMEAREAHARRATQVRRDWVRREAKSMFGVIIPEDNPPGSDGAA